MMVSLIMSFTYISQNELCRMKLDLSVLDELVREYCIYRGIVDSGRGALSGETQTFIPFYQ